MGSKQPGESVVEPARVLQSSNSEPLGIRVDGGLIREEEAERRGRQSEALPSCRGQQERRRAENTADGKDSARQGQTGDEQSASDPISAAETPNLLRLAQSTSVMPQKNWERAAEEFTQVQRTVKTLSDEAGLLQQEHNSQQDVKPSSLEQEPNQFGDATEDSCSSQIDQTPPSTGATNLSDTAMLQEVLEGRVVQQGCMEAAPKLTGQAIRPEQAGIPHTTHRTVAAGYAIDPSTGRAVKYGPAMASKLTRVELPSITAMFQRAKQNPMQPRTQQAVRGRLPQSLSRPASRPRLEHCSHQAVEHGPPGLECHGQEVLQGRCLATFAPVPARESVRSPFEEAGQPAMDPGFPLAASREPHGAALQAAASAGKAGLHCEAQVVQGLSPSEGFPQLPQFPSGFLATRPALPHGLQSRSSAPSRMGCRGFGSIISGVLEAARSSEEPSVYRIEEMHRRTQEQRRFKGVRRAPWGILWTAFLPASELQGEEQELGQFQDPETAARAYDVALLKLTGGAVPDRELNFPHAAYDAQQLSQIRQAPVAEFLASLHSYGVFGDRRSSRFYGVVRSGKRAFHARAAVEDDAEA